MTIQKQWASGDKTLPACRVCMCVCVRQDQIDLHLYLTLDPLEKVLLNVISNTERLQETAERLVKPVAFSQKHCLGRAVMLYSTKASNIRKEKPLRK